MNENNKTKLPCPNCRNNNYICNNFICNNYTRNNFIHLNRPNNPSLFISDSFPQGFPL